MKRFYVRVPLNDAACCRVTDLSSYRSGSCCLNGASVEIARAAAAVHASWYGQMAPPVGVLDAFVSIHGVPLDRVAVGTVVTATVESVSTRPAAPSGRRWRPAAAATTGSVARGGTLSFAATEANATLVAYVAHDGSGGEAANVVACAKKIGVTFAADATAGFGFRDPHARRVGGGTGRRRASDLRWAHDVSVLIQSGGRQSAMSASKILEAASSPAAPAPTPARRSTRRPWRASWCWPPRTWTRASWFCSPP